MTEDQLELLQEAQRSISAAKLLLEGGYARYAASRAYYAMFYVAESFLEGEGLSFSTHSAVIAAFGRHFTRTGKVPAEFHQSLRKAWQVRLTGDYSPGTGISSDEAQDQIHRAEQFLKLAEQLIGPLPPDEETK